ncbi:MAG: acyl-CoA dehydrogenase, partial [Acidimicrobiaceae bacterium]|nr:acyl-CoA dehydrogenase [Acidimicrobiaceae bacterium]
MDFELGEEEQAIRDLTAQVLYDMSSHERLKALAAEGDHVDRKAWAALAATGVVGASIPEAHGGLGLGFLATAVALEEVGRRASPVPLLTTAVMGAMPIAAFGTDAQKAAWLPGIADGSVLACAALAEDGTDPVEPTTAARSDNGGFVLDG